MNPELLRHLERDLAAAVAHFWAVRADQAGRQGGEDATARDRGAHGAVTGGRQMDGFVRLVYDLLVASGLNNATLFIRSRTELPGWFRPEKDWDLLVVADRRLIAAIEFKSQVGPSFGNNFNNRTEEALGRATDLWAAFRQGAFAPSAPPWVGFLMLLEDAPGSARPVRATEPHFPVFPEFRNASYAKRYELLLTKLVRERLYDSACLLLSPRPSVDPAVFFEPSTELCFRNFVTPLLGRAMAVAAAQPPAPAQPPRVEAASPD